MLPPTSLFHSLLPSFPPSLPPSLTPSPHPLQLELFLKSKVCGHQGQLLALGAGLLGMGVAELELLPAVDLERTMKSPGLR